MLCLAAGSKAGDEGRVFLGLRPRLFLTVVGTKGGKGEQGDRGGRE